MQAARVVEKGKVELVDLPDPEPGPGEVLIRMTACGICGSDLHVYRGAWSTESKIGHELCGVVEALGPGVSGVQVGARVCAECFAHCGECDPCRAGDYNLCRAGSWLGDLRHSGMADRTVMPAGTLFPVPEPFTDLKGMMVEPMAVSFRACARAAVGTGRSVGVIGAGTIGLLCVGAAKAAGAGPIVAVAKHPHQAQAAAEMGADLVVTLGERKLEDALADVSADARLDAMIDTVGVGTSFTSALAAVRWRGRVVMVAGVTRPLLTALGPLVGRELHVTGSQCYAVTDGKPDFLWAIELIESGAVDAARLVTHTFPLDRVDEAFAAANDKSSGAIKVAVTMGG